MRYSNISDLYKQVQRNSFKRAILNLSEKLGANATMGDYISDFEKSDAPQFKGRTKEQRKKMAIAAFLDKTGQTREELELDEDNSEQIKKLEKMLKDLEGQKKKTPGGGFAKMKIKQLNVFIDSVDGDKIDFTSVFYDIIIKKYPALKAGRFETVSLNPSELILNPGTMLSRYICSGGKTEIELYDTVNVSERLWILARNLTNTDGYTITTELILYDV